MKKNILIFAGTTEGRQLAEYAVKEGIPCIVSAATEYGEELLENDLQLQKEKNKKAELRVIHGRMDQQEMEAFFEKEQVGLVIDATHPFAVIVTENIQQACKNSGIEYLRCLRDFLTEAKAVRSEKFACERTNAITKSDSSVVCVNSVEEAVYYLEQTQGNILITTGSKELDKYTRLTNYKEYRSRIFREASDCNAGPVFQRNESCTSSSDRGKIFRNKRIRKEWRICRKA